MEFISATIYQRLFEAACSTFEGDELLTLSYYHPKL
jgi:hypothetical protein